ncbi:hypothetical protein [Actinophytocola xanthii]|uniref:hypothetical protein n=1 Tax=Actinophytocola xanthii TaxID=1912961 RepID=UPI0009F860BA|nr:hypothetical protein [Actinophytocola xanthii]
MTDTAITDSAGTDSAVTTDRVTDAYLRRCLAGDRGLLDAVARAPFGQAFLAANGDQLLPRPLFLAEETVGRFSADLAVFFDLLTSLPERLFDGDTAGYCAALGMERRRAAILSRHPGRPERYGRVDAYHDGESLRLLEFNIGSAQGGIDRSEIGRMLLRVDAFAEFAAEHGLVHVHTGEKVARLYREAARELTGGADPVVGFVESDSGFGPYEAVAESYVEMMAAQGLEVVLGTVGELTERDGRLFLHGRRIDLIQRHFTENEMVTEPGVARAAERVFRAHDAGRVVLWTSLRSSLYHNKAALALMSDSRLRDAFTAEEAELVDRVLPWTRLLTPGETEAGGETVDLLGYCREHRESLILKPQRSFRGQGIVAGWATGDQNWADALADGVEQGALVQRRVVRRAEQVVLPETGEVEEYAATWGVYLVPDGYAGCSLRTMPIDDEVARHAPTRRAGAVFQFPAGAS